jgi:tRNA G26 N,N-dimethylase Trm1
MMALCGVAPQAGSPMPKYLGATAIKCEFVHEVAVRLLLGLIARKSTRIMKPLVSLSTDHYIRVFVKFLKPQTSNLKPKNIGYVNYNPRTGKRSLSKTPKKGYKQAGPLWIGKLWDKPFLKKLDFEHKLLDMMIEEANGKPLFYSVRELYKGKQQPKLTEVMKKFKATRTHFKDQAVRLK